MSSVDGYISELGVDVEDLPQLTDEEEEAAIAQSLEDLSSKKFDKKVERSFEEISAVREDLRDKQDELEDLLRGDNVSDADEARIEEALEEIEAMLDGLKEFKESLSDYVDDHKEWEDLLLERAKKLHADQTFPALAELTAENSPHRNPNRKNANL